MTDPQEELHRKIIEEHLEELGEALMVGNFHKVQLKIMAKVAEAARVSERESNIWVSGDAVSVEIITPDKPVWANSGSEAEYIADNSTAWSPVAFNPYYDEKYQPVEVLFDQTQDGLIFSADHCVTIDLSKVKTASHHAELFHVKQPVTVEMLTEVIRRVAEKMNTPVEHLPWFSFFLNQVSMETAHEVNPGRVFL